MFYWFKMIRDRTWIPVQDDIFKNIKCQQFFKYILNKATLNSE